MALICANIALPSRLMPLLGQRPADDGILIAYDGKRSRDYGHRKTHDGNPIAHLFANEEQPVANIGETSANLVHPPG